MNTDITAYNDAQDGERRTICKLLATEIHRALPQAEYKIWHGSPVWFLQGNPVVGYAARKHNIQLLFWSGQSFDEPGLEPEGTFKAAQARYTDASQVDTADLQRWLEKAQKIQWDYKNIVKRRGELIRLDEV
ncbi:MAG TPA: DUF1801 domain-containing protein [Candidatus Saccharimonadales bacterium]|nr:DUF1801 domain-containing protein [Candidatus Saccharimonadales bacterium]